MSASVGLIALWTGQLTVHVAAMEEMAIHQLSDTDLDLFAKHVQLAEYQIKSLSQYVTKQQEES